MPDWIQLAPYYGIKITMQCAIKVPVFHFHSSVALFEFGDRNFDAFKNSILDVAH